MIGIASLWIGTRVRDRDFEENIGNLHKSAAASEERSKELEQRNLTLQRDIEREKTERLKLEEKFSARSLSDAQRGAVLAAFKGMKGRVYVRCIDEIEACVAAGNFAALLRQAGFDVPEVEGVGMTMPPTLGIEVYDPAGENGLFARTLVPILPDARFRPGPFIIAGQPLDPANPAIVVRMKLPPQRQ